MFSSTRLAGLALCLAATFAALAPAQVAASRGRGLTQFYDSTFYRNLDKHRFYRKNVNNLDALLKLVVNGPIVSTTVLNRGYKEFAANWHYAISRFGRVRDIIVVTFDGESLIECLNLGFACYNGTNLLPASEQLHPDDVTHGNEHFYRLNWGKVVFVNALLTRQYDVFLSDLDTVWLKDAHRSMMMVLDKYDADVVAMNDGGGGNPNVGNMLLRHNNRTLNLVGTWAARALDNSTGKPLVRKDQQEQAHMWTMKDTHWVACNSPTECAAVKAQGKAAMWLHPWHGCPWEHFEYSKARWAGKICDNELAYLHIFCTAGGTPHKTEMATKIGVWFVDPEARSPIMRGASSWELVDMPETHPIKDSMPLPCPNEVAWV